MAEKPREDDLFGSIPINSDIPEQTEEPKDDSHAVQEEKTVQETVQPQPKSPHRRIRRKRKSPYRFVKWLFAIPVLASALYIAAGYFLVPYLVKTVVAKKFGKRVERSVTFGAAEFDPFSLILTLHNGIIGSRQTNPEDTIDPILSFSKLTIDFAAISMAKQGVVCQEADIEKLFLHIVRRKDSSYNIFELFPSTMQAAKEGKTESVFEALQLDFPFSLNNISVHDSSLIFEDRPAGKTHNLKNVSLALPTLSNFSYQTVQFIQPKFSATINDSPVELTGETKIIGSQVEARLKLHFKTDDLPTYLGYLPLQFNFMTSRGKTDLHLNLVFNSGGPPETRLSIEGTGDFIDVWLLAPNGKELARLPSVKVIGMFSPLANNYKIEELQFIEPRFNLEKMADGQYIFPWRKPETLGQEQSPKELPSKSRKKEAAARIAINHFLIKDGKLSYVDQAVKGGFADTWEDIQLTVTSYTNLGKEPATFAISAINKGNTRISCQGNISSQPLKIQGLVVADQVDLSKLAPFLYTGQQQHFKSGLAKKINTQFTLLTEGKTHNLRLHELDTLLTSVSITENGRDVLVFPKLTIKHGALNFGKKIIDFGELATESGYLFLSSDQSRQTNWDNFAISSGSQKKNAGWSINFKSLAVKNGSIDYVNQTFSEPLALKFEKVAILTETLQDQTGSQNIALSSTVNTKGHVQCSGALVASPLATDMQCTLENLEITSVQPLFSEWLMPNITHGTLQAAGEVHYPKATFTGDAEISNFAAAANNEIILRCEKAQLEGIDFTSSPFELKTFTVALHKPFFNYTIWDTNRSTYSYLFRKKVSDQTTKPTDTTIQIRQVSISDGIINFTDNSTAPPYTAPLSEINGEIMDYENSPAKHSRLSLTGNLQGKAAASLVGTMSLFDDDAFADLEVKVSNLDVPPLALYLKSNLSAPIDKGQLDIKAKMRLEKGFLDTSNSFRFFGLQLGSPLSPKSQLPLAVALFSDPKGNIAVDIPVSGQMNDPSFSYRGHILRGFRNILLKTAVSPFSYLTSFAGDAAPLDHMFFPAGSAHLNDEGKEHLDTLAQILLQRPLLNLRIQGFADNKKDRQALLDKIRTRISQARIEKEKDISMKLTNVYGKEEVVIPELPASKNESLSANASDRKITEETLVRLASRRSHAVQQYLTEKGGLSINRVKAEKTGSLIIDESMGKAGNRVDFILSTAWR